MNPQNTQTKAYPLAQELPQRLRRFSVALACPQCKSALDWSAKAAHCRDCDVGYSIRDGKVFFIDTPPADDALDSVKSRLKRRLGPLYYRIGVWLIAPTYPFDYGAALRRYLDFSNALVVDLGSGNQRVDEHVLCVDCMDYDVVDVVCDLARLPFRDGCVDAMASRSVLEHVPELAMVVKEIGRCTRAGGLSLHLIPFLYPFHASPHDYQRLTHAGARKLFEGWQVEEQKNATGPFTLLLLWATEFGATILSFGSPRLRAFAYLGLCAVLFPIKFLDAPFIGRDSFLAMAPSIFSVLRKGHDQ